MTKKTLVALAATMALALPAMAPTAATAGTNDTEVIVDGATGAMTRSVSVSVADLNLASANGQRRADYRLIRASKQVCGYMNGSVLNNMPDFRQCYDGAIDGARADLNQLVQRLG